MRNVTMSALPRVMNCAASAVLPATRETNETPWATRGRVLHAFLRDVCLEGREHALERVPLEHYEACAELELEQLPLDPEAYAPEVALAYDWANDTGREIDRGTDSRAYGASPTEIAGRADVIGLDGECIHVLDYKTGYRYLGRPDESWQLRGYALAAMRAYGGQRRFRRARLTFVRVPEDGVPYLITQEIDVWALEDAALQVTLQAQLVERLREQGAAADVARLEEHLRAGSWCTYCPAFGRCPEKAGLVRELVGELEAPALTPETAPLVYQRWQHAKKALALVEEALRQYAGAEGEQPIPVVDAPGLVWGAKRLEKKELDPVRGAAVIGQRFGPEVAARAVEQRPRLTKASLRRAIEAPVRKAKLRIGAAMGELLDALEQGGAVRTRWAWEFREHRPDEAGLTEEVDT